MANNIIRLFAGGAAVNTQTAPEVKYTVPAGKRVIIKSITVSNGQNTAARFTLSIGGYLIVYNHLIQPYDTIALPAAGLILSSGEVLGFGHSNYCNVSVTGIIVEGADKNLPYIFTRSSGLTTSITGTQSRSTTSDTLIKSVNFCNYTASDATVSLQIGGNSILSNHTIKAYDTLTLPFLDQLLLKNEYLQAWSNTAGAVVYIANGIAVNT